MTDGLDPRRESLSRPKRRSPSLVVAFVLSAIVHLLILLLYPVWRNRPTGDLPEFPFDEIRLEGTEIITLRELSDEEEEPTAVTTPPPEEERRAPVPVPVPEAEAPRPTPAEPDEPDRTPAERLRPNEDNTRLWIPVSPDLTELTPEEQLQLEIDMVLRMWNDSMAALAEEERAATDWTHTDEEGNRWGISPGQLHLGKVTIPLPIYFGPANGWQREELAERAFELGDIERGALTGAVRESMKQRAAAIRARKDAEREQEQEEESKKKAATPPDTTRSRR